MRQIPEVITNLANRSKSGLQNRFSRGSGSGAPRRILVIVLLLAAFAYQFVVDAPRGERAPDPVAASGVAPAGVLSSAWYCGLVPSVRSDSSAGSITMANPNANAVTGIASVSSIKGETKDVPVTVAPFSRAVMRPGTIIDAPFVGVMLRFEGGGIVVEHTSRTELGASTAPCATTASHSWYLTDMTTQPGASLKLGIFNPFDQDAVVNGVFPTDNDVLRPATPTNLDGMIVKARSLAVVELGENLFRREWISGSITTRSGRVVVEALQSGSMFGGKGVASIAASPELSDTWYIPNVSLEEGKSARLSVFNPTNNEAMVRVTIVSDRDVDPFELMVPAQSREKLDFPTDRLPIGSVFTAVVKTMNDSPKVTVQLIGANAPPASPVGAWSKLGTTAPGKLIVFPVGDTREPAEETITIVNVGKAPTTVRMRSLGDDGKGTDLTPVEIAPGRRAVVVVDEQVSAGTPAIDIQADQPMVASRTMTSTASGLVDTAWGTIVRD